MQTLTGLGILESWPHLSPTAEHWARPVPYPGSTVELALVVGNGRADPATHLLWGGTGAKAMCPTTTSPSPPLAIGKAARGVIPEHHS